MALIAVVLMFVVPPVLVVKPVNSVVLPTKPANVVLPVVLTVKVCAPSTVLLNAIAEFPLLSTTRSVPNVTALPYV